MEKINQMRMDEEEHTRACSRVTIWTMFGNLLISIIYLLTGTLGHSAAALAEGVDSLTDAASSLLLLLGFKIAAKKPDSLHPNGHKRIEYIVGLLISELILVAAVSLAKQSAGYFMHPNVSSVSLVLLLVSGVGALGKLLIAKYIKRKNKLYESTSLKVYYKNTLADLKGICFVAVSAVIQHFTVLPIDALAGIIISVMIGLDGVKSFMENVSLLIGENRDIKQESHTYAN